MSSSLLFLTQQQSWITKQGSQKSHQCDAKGKTIDRIDAKSVCPGPHRENWWSIKFKRYIYQEITLTKNPQMRQFILAARNAKLPPRAQHPQSLMNSSETGGSVFSLHSAREGPGAVTSIFGFSINCQTLSNLLYFLNPRLLTYKMTDDRLDNNEWPFPLQGTKIPSVIYWEFWDRPALSVWFPSWQLPSLNSIRPQGLSP